MNKFKLSFTSLLLMVFLFASCWTDKSKPNYQYMPDMYESVGYETYSENPVFENKMTSQLPVSGTIARGQKAVYAYPDNEEGYELAKSDLLNPLEKNPSNLEKGNELYQIYCTLCHGKTGIGDGELVKRDKFLGVPNYKDREITEGSIYHVIMYGRNMMGSHASQLTEKERWQITMYAQQLRDELLNK